MKYSEFYQKVHWRRLLSVVLLFGVIAGTIAWFLPYKYIVEFSVLTFLIGLIVGMFTSEWWSESGWR